LSLSQALLRHYLFSVSFKPPMAVWTLPSSFIVLAIGGQRGGVARALVEGYSVLLRSCIAQHLTFSQSNHRYVNQPWILGYFQ
jgi:hypothetical protein